MQPLFKDLRVLDLTKVFSGPFATRMLADYGAEVIKIESEKRHDDSREYPPLKNGWSGYYEILNRNKKGIALDLKNSDDLKKFYTLCREADVLAENLTPSTKHKLHIDYETLHQINPRIIYASLSGEGQHKNSKYYDVIAQAQSGLMSLSGTPDQPMKIGPSVVDAFSGMTLAFAISSALYHREKTGEGQYIDVSMIACAMNLLENNLISYSITKQNPVRSANVDNAIAPFGAYKTKDSYIVLAAGNNSLWQKLATFLKAHVEFSDELFATNELRLQHAQMLTKNIEAVFTQFTTVQLHTSLSELNIPCSPVNEMSDVYQDQELYQDKALIKMQHSKLGEIAVPGQSIHFSNSKMTNISQAPSIGQDDAEYGV